MDDLYECPNCGGRAAEKDCQECFGLGRTDDGDEDCPECDGLGTIDGEYKCPECGYEYDVIGGKIFPALN